MTLTIIALGSNLDNPPKQLKEACFRLSRLKGLTGLRVSSVFTSPPMGPQDQPPFFNAVATCLYTEEPRRLMAELQAIEQAMGRVKVRHWGERCIAVSYTHLTLPTSG